MSNDDFVLLRKDIPIEKVFNIAFLAGASSLLGARVLFVVLHPNTIFFNPLVFLALPYFPGLSLVGGMIGAIAAFFLLTREDKIPKARLFDFFSISFLLALPFGFLGYFLLSKITLSLYAISTIIIYLALFIVFIKLLRPLLMAGNLKEGTIGLIFLVSFSLTSIVENFIVRLGKAFHFTPHQNGAGFTIEDFILIIMLIMSSALLIKHENLLTKVKKLLEAKKL